MRANARARASQAERAQADARGVPADIMMPRILLIVATILLVLIGLVMVFSASTVEAIDQGESIFSYVSKQAAFVAIGAICAWVVVRFIPYQAWRQGPLFYVFWGIAVVLLVAVMVIGISALGAQRWIRIGFFSLQPSEFAKIILVIAGARVLCDFTEEVKDLKQTIVATVVLVLAPLGFLYVTQSDMGSAIIILMGLFGVMWIGEVPKKVFFAGLAIVVAVGAVGLVGYRADRMAVWLNPWNDGEGGYGTGFQTIRSYYAFAEGGIFGVGLGNSREKFLYLPEAETDFIFSIIGEELGLVGALFVIALFLVVLFSGLRIAAKAPDAFGRMLAGGLTAMLVGQAFLNMACATGLFPTTGKPLPFISSGGSSVIASLLIVGVILSVSKGSNTLTPYERRRNDLDVIRAQGSTARRASGSGLKADAGGRKAAVRGADAAARASAAAGALEGSASSRAGRSGRAAKSGGIRLGGVSRSGLARDAGERSADRASKRGASRPARDTSRSRAQGSSGSRARLGGAFSESGRSGSYARMRGDGERKRLR